MKKFLGVFVLFTIVIFFFTGICIYFTEKTDLLGLEDMPIEVSFQENNGKMQMTWKKFPYPCVYRVETFYRTTGLVEGSPEYQSISSEYTLSNSYSVPGTAIPVYYKIVAYGIFGKLSSPNSYIPNPNYTDPIKPVPIYHYTSDNPASTIPYLVWHSVPDGVIYELELLKAPPKQENSNFLDGKNTIFSTRQIFTNGIQLNLDPYLKNNQHIYWRVRALNLRMEPVGVFSTAEEIIVDKDKAIPNKPLLNDFDKMPNALMPAYPVYNWIPMYGAVAYEVEMMTHPPVQENNTEPTVKVTWRMKVNSNVFSCYDEYARYYAGKYYWRVRGLDAKGNTLGVYSDTAEFVVPDYHGCLVAAFGDSITHGGGAVSFSPANLEYSYLTYCDFPIMNLGHSGDTSETTMQRFDSDVLPIMPKNLLIMTGSNSLRNTKCDAEAIIANLQAIGQKCDQAGIRPIFMTLPPMNPSNLKRAFGYDTDPNWLKKVEKINAFIRNQDYYIDLEPYFYDITHSHLDSRWANDGLHMDVRGKMLMAEIINKHQNLFKR